MFKFENPWCIWTWLRCTADLRCNVMKTNKTSDGSHETQVLISVLPPAPNQLLSTPLKLLERFPLWNQKTRQSLNSFSIMKFLSLCGRDVLSDAKGQRWQWRTEKTEIALSAVMVWTCHRSSVPQVHSLVIWSSKHFMLHRNLVIPHPK